MAGWEGMTMATICVSRPGQLSVIWLETPSPTSSTERCCGVPSEMSAAARRHVFERGSACLYLRRVHGKEALIHVDLRARPPADPADDRGCCASAWVSASENVLFERSFFAHDPAHRLPNRTRSSIASTRVPVDWRGLAAGIIDIVRFAELNDALGHRSGDLLLVEVTRRLQAWVGPAPWWRASPGMRLRCVLAVRGETGLRSWTSSRCTFHRAWHSIPMRAGRASSI